MWSENRDLALESKLKEIQDPFFWKSKWSSPEAMTIYAAAGDPIDPVLVDLFFHLRNSIWRPARPNISVSMDIRWCHRFWL